MRIYFDNLDVAGIIPDIPSDRLPYNAWTDGRNVRFSDGAVEKFDGQQDAYGTAMASPYYAIPIYKGQDYWWVYCSLTGIYSTDGAVHYDVTPTTATPAAQIDLNWTGGHLGGGVLVLNDGTGTPYQWNGTLLSENFTLLENWPSGMYARVLRPFKQVLVAGNVDEGSGLDGSLVRWSHPAAPGEVPASWDDTDDAFDAGRATLPQGGVIVEMEPLHDIMMIYKEEAVWGMQYVGGNAIYAFRKIFDQLGVMSRRCVKEFNGRHVVMSTDDVVIHDGTSVVQALDKRIRKWLFANIDGDNAPRSFVVPNFARNEVWICFPETGESLPNLAVVWNWNDGTPTIRELGSNVAHIARGIVSLGGGATFADYPGTFADASTVAWSGAQDVNTIRNLLICDTSNNRLMKADQDYTFNGTNYQAYVLRENLPLGRVADSQDRRSMDPATIKYVTDLFAEIEGTDGGQLTVSIGTRMSESDTVSWSDYTWTIGQTTRIPLRERGRFFSIKFSSNTDVYWRLVSFSLEVKYGGVR